MQKHKLATCGIVFESARSVNRFGIHATARFPADSSSCCRRCKRKMHSEKEYLSLRQRSETKERVKVAKDLGGFARKRSARGRGGREFASDDPRQNLFPILRRGSSEDRKSTRLNSSHANISYAVFCLKKKKTTQAVAILTTQRLRCEDHT